MSSYNNTEFLIILVTIFLQRVCVCVGGGGGGRGEDGGNVDWTQLVYLWGGGGVRMGETIGIFLTFYKEDNFCR